MFTTRPHRLRLMAGSAARIVWNIPSISARSTPCHAASSTFVMSCRGSHDPPALFTRMSTGPSSCSARVNIFRTSSPFAVSARATMARVPSPAIAFTRRRLFVAEVRPFVPWFRTTSAPSRAKVSAMLLPMPSPVLPVTRAARPLSDPDMLREPHPVNNCIEADPHEELSGRRRPGGPKFRISDFRAILFIAREGHGLRDGLDHAANRRFRHVRYRERDSDRVGNRHRPPVRFANIEHRVGSRDSGYCLPRLARGHAPDEGPRSDSKSVGR